MTKRRLLPRKEVARYDSRSFVSKQSPNFRDQDTILFTTDTLVEMPTGLPKDFSTSSTSFTYGERFRDLVSSSSQDALYVTGTVFWGSFDNFLQIDPLYSASSDPFVEVRLYEYDGFDDAFFSTGSNVLAGDGSLAKPLSNKQKVTKQFNVSTITKLPASVSSFYSFDTGDGKWKTPESARSIIVSSPFEKLAINTTDSTAAQTPKTKGSNFIEDAIGFDAYGNFAASGSNNIIRTGTSSKQTIALTNDDSKFDYLLSRSFTKSATVSSDFDVSGSSLFSIDVERPFLVEKAVVEIPMCAGVNWFSDRTVLNFLTASGADFKSGSTEVGKFSHFDIGGPGLVASLFCQKSAGKTKIRELVAKSLITHEGDIYNSSIDFTQRFIDVNPSVTWAGVVNGLGLQRPWDAIIKSGSISSFTGSVTIPMTAKSHNGLGYCLAVQIAGVGGIDATMTRLEALLNKEYLLTSDANTDNYVQFPISISPFGRGMSGFSPGTSAFGLDNAIFSSSGKLFKNPFYIADESTRLSTTASFKADYTASGATTEGFDLVTYGYFGEDVTSPYLMLPGDRLLLTISKTRPSHGHLKGVDISVGKPYTLDLGKFTWTSSSFYNHIPDGTGHDIQLNTGSVNITLYGSYVAQDGEYK